VGIFSLFGKKNVPNKRTSSDSRPTKSAREGKGGGAVSSETDSGFSNSSMQQRHIARATERKIDAIEIEMSRDIIKKKTAANSSPTQIASPPTIAHTRPINTDNNIFQATITALGSATEFLFDNLSSPAPSKSQIETIPAMEEAAILFASGQPDLAEKSLLHITNQENKSKQATKAAWWMLFDLYQVTQKKQEFEQLSLNYVSTFEVSAPTWIESTPQQAEPSPLHPDSGTMPRVLFSGKINDHITNSIKKLRNLSDKHKTLNIEFTRITEVDQIGCDLLLQELRHLKKSGHKLILSGATELSKHIRKIIQVGRRDDTEAPWLLLMEILQFLNEENAFEDLSMDYCITFEVSPPPFVRSVNVTTSAPSEVTVEIAAALIDTPPFLMPKLIEGKIDQLIKEIVDFSAENNAIKLDCSQLVRVDFSSCGQLLTSLISLTSDGKKTIEFHAINYLVMTLFTAMGYKNIATMYPQKK